MCTRTSRHPREKSTGGMYGEKSRCSSDDECAAPKYPLAVVRETVGLVLFAFVRYPPTLEGPCGIDGSTK